MNGQATAQAVRPIYEIAREIKREWPKPYFGAVPYLDAMTRVANLDDPYIAEDGRTQVVYFLANANTWRGEAARRIKKELNAMLKAK